MEKRYFSNWSLFLLVLIVGNVAIALLGAALRQVVGDSPTILYTVSYVLEGLLVVGLLILLLAMRGPWMESVAATIGFPSAAVLEMLAATRKNWTDSSKESTPKCIAQNVAGRIQQHHMQLRSHTATSEWSEYE